MKDEWGLSLEQQHLDRVRLSGSVMTFPWISPPPRSSMVSDIAWTPVPTRTAKPKAQLPILPPLPPCRRMLAWPFVRELCPLIPHWPLYSTYHCPAPTITVRESTPETTLPPGIIRAIREVPTCHRPGRFPSVLSFLLRLSKFHGTRRANRRLSELRDGDEPKSATLVKAIGPIPGK